MSVDLPKKKLMLAHQKWKKSAFIQLEMKLKARFYDP